MSHPYRDLIERDAKRAEDDLAAFRARALTVVTTSAGVVTLLTGLTAFSASKSEEEAGLPRAGVWFVGFALGFFLISAVLALLAQRAGEVKTADKGALVARTVHAQWYEKTEDGEPDTDDQERVAAKLTAEYAETVHGLAQDVAKKTNLAIAAQIVALALASIAALIFLVQT